MDWVEWRAERDERIGKGSSLLWVYLLASLEHAVNSYQRLYGKGSGETKFLKNNGQVVIAWVPFGSVAWSEAERRSVTVTREGPYIEADYWDGSILKIDFTLNEDAEVTFRIDNAILGIEDLSERILTKVLFDP